FSHRFQKYDYGKKRNLKIYGEEIPPLYPIGKISVPTLIVSSDKDDLITQQVIRILNFCSRSYRLKLKFMDTGSFLD
ncbi:unnamed protein product, partial [Tenebrio molitor]